MRLGILGGTFDPIHVGHLMTAEVVRDTLQLDHILFIPAGDPPHKQAINKTPAHHRWAMTELAIADNPHFTLSPIDFDRPGPHYSVDTVQIVRANYHLEPDECIFIIGSDSLVNLPTWHKPKEFIEQCRLGVVHRPNYLPDMESLNQALPGLQHRIDWLEMPEIGLASSHVRAKAKQGHSIRYQVPSKVMAYIIQHRLYQPTRR